MSNIKAEIDTSPPSGSVNLQITVIFKNNKNYTYSKCSLNSFVATILQ